MRKHGEWLEFVELNERVGPEIKNGRASRAMVDYIIPCMTYHHFSRGYTRRHYSGQL